MAAQTVVAHGGALDDWFERRRALGQDTHDEVWEGVYHVAPHAPAEHARLVVRLLVALHERAVSRGLEGLAEFNLGQEGDYRVPDLAWVREGVELPLYVPTAVVVGEVLSPGDASRDKVPFYLAREVEEVWLIDPVERSVTITRPGTERVTDSAALGVSVEEIRTHLGW
ncbi:hypothetical protein GCM10027586_01050 [Kineococcus gypseus]|uniref:Uma2 family endonuclease n=1 Tax=Kineococcus gypseus TaxID=1637102 RepID=UPI003D7C9CAC